MRNTRIFSTNLKPLISSGKSAADDDDLASTVLLGESPPDFSPQGLDTWLKQKGLKRQPLLARDALLIKIAAGPEDESLAHCRFAAAWRLKLAVAIGAPFPTGAVTHALGRPKSDMATISRFIKGTQGLTESDWKTTSKITGCPLIWLVKGEPPHPPWIVAYYEAVRRARNFQSLVEMLGIAHIPLPKSKEELFGNFVNQFTKNELSWFPNILLVLDRTEVRPQGNPVSVTMSAEFWEDIQVIIPRCILCAGLMPGSMPWHQTIKERLGDLSLAIEKARKGQKTEARPRKRRSKPG